MEIAVGIHLEWNSNKGGLVDGLPDFQVPAYDDNDLYVKTFHLKEASEKIFLRAFHLSTEEMKRRRFRHGFLLLESTWRNRDVSKVAQIFWKWLKSLGPNIVFLGPYLLFHYNDDDMHIIYIYIYYVYIYTHVYT